MKGKMFKKTLSCLLAIMMVVASVPVAGITAQAADSSTATTSLAASYVGVIQGESNSRWTSSTKTVNLVNDQCESNFDVAYATFDVSSLSLIPQSVTYDITVKCDNGREALGVATYYATANTNYFLTSSDSPTKATLSSNTDLYNNVFSGEKVDHIGRAKTYFGLTTMGETIETTANGTTYKHTVDITSAVRNAKKNGSKYAYVVFLAGKQGDYKGGDTTTGTKWSDTDLCLSSASATATYSTSYKSITATSDIKIGVIYDGEGTRYKTDNGTYVTVANDQQNSNFTIGYFSFDVSSFSSSQQAVEAQYTFNEFLLDNESEAMGLTYYYPTTNVSDFVHSNGAVNKSSVTSIYKSGNNSDYISSAISYYGLVKMGSFTTAAKEKVNRTIDISAAINTALNAGRSKAVVAFMLSAPGGSGPGKSSAALDSYSTSGSYWSDTMLKLTNTSLSVKMQDIPGVSLNEVKSAVNSYSGYKGTFSTNINSQSSSSYNVLYSSNPTTYTTNEMTYSSPSGTNGDWWASYIIRYCIPTMTMLYDGTQPYNTMLFAAKRKDPGCKHVYLNMVYPASTSGSTADSSEFGLKEKWTGYSTDFGVPTSSSNQVGYSSTTRYGTITFSDSYYLFQNKLYYTATPSTTLTSINKMYWRSQSDAQAISTQGDDVGSTNTKNRRAQGTSDVDADIHIVNITSLKSIADKLKNGTETEYANILKDKDRYYGDESKVDAYLKAVYDVVTFNPNTYFSTTKNDYSGCATKINTLVSDYNTAKMNLVPKYEIKFINNANETVDTQIVLKGSIVTTTASNSEPKYTQITGNETKHNKITYTWPTITATKDQTVNENATTSTEDCTVTDGKCTVCGKKFLDFSAYKSALAESSTFIVEIAQGIYTESSGKSYKEIYLEVKDIESTATTQQQVDEATIKLLYAKALLAKKTANVTLVIYDKDGKKIEETTPYKYIERGETVTVTPATKHNVVKWVVVSGDAKYEVIGENASLDIVLTDDTTVEAHCDDSVNDTSVAYTKVVFKGANGKVVDIRYVKAGETLNTSDVDKPSVALYNVSDWSVASVTGSADTKVVNVTVSCEPQSTNMCEVYFPGKPNDPVKLPYNTRVDIKDYIQDSNIEYALASDESRQNIIAYLDGTVFYVPARADVYVTKKAVGSKTTMINTTGVYSTLVGDYKKIGFNNKFTLAKDCKAVEWGIVFIATKTDGTIITGTKLPVKALSPEKEFTATISVSKTNTTYQSIRAKAYLKYRDSTGAETTIYGDEYTQAFTTDTTIGGTKL